MRRLLALSLVTVVLASCNVRPLGLPGEVTTQASSDVFPQGQNNKADILFVIDTSDSMEAKQESLKRYFANFMEPLKRLPTPPDLHIGIVTTDMGAGPTGYGNCQPGGERGVLQNAQKGTTCGAAHLDDASRRFLSYAIDPDGGNPITNFTGDIADAFACYASVGTGGCGFEHQLASMKAALAGCDQPGGCTQKLNAGFLRPDAYLAVIVLTDEDDCSAPPDSALFDSSAGAISALGPYASYRCFQYGVLCSGVDPGRAQGPRSSCMPGNASPDPRYQLTPVEEIATFLKGLKPQDPRMVYLSVIAAPAQPVMVGANNGTPGMMPACTGGLTVADAGKLDRESPAIRLTRLVGLFDQDRASFISICADDLKAAMEQVATEIGRIFHHCLASPLVDADTASAGLQPECVVEDRVTVDAQAGTFTVTAVPPCAEVVCDPAIAPGGDCKCQRHELPAGGACWYVWSDQKTCPMIDSTKPVGELRGLASGYQFRIDRGTDVSCNKAPAATGTSAVVQCASCLANPAKGAFDCSPGCAAYWPKCCATDEPSADCLQ
ncbi:MAG: hypothetical protein HY906_23375 [Deltaproteobacteria bacterium]|nr:hypothetical protein [Deltaproteobacteria bacterium]